MPAILKGAAALALLVGGAAWADTATIRLAVKDLNATDPVAVAHVARIEAALAGQGHAVAAEVVDLPDAGYADALGLMLLGGDVPDLIYFQGGDAKVAAQGLLEDWRPWIEGAEHLKAALYPHNAARLESYPYLLHVFPPRAPLPVIRADWLERAGTGVPETVEDYVALFRAVRDGDLDGNGADDTWAVALAGATGAGGVDELDAVFDRAFGITGTWMEDAQGRWISARVSEEERDKLRFYRQLFAEGLLDPEYLTTTWDVREDMFYTGRAGVILGSSAEVIDIYGAKLRQVEPDAELALLPPPAGPGGEGGARAVDVSREERGFALSALSEHKEEVVALLDFMASPEGQALDRLGFEGEHHVRQGGRVQATETMGTWFPRFMAAANWQPPVPLLSEAASAALDLAAADFVADNAFVVPPELAADLDAAGNVQKAWSFRFVSGEASLDDDWGAFVAEWNAAGGARLTDHARSVL